MESRKLNHAPSKMKFSLLAYLLVLANITVFGQSTDTWTAFLSKDTLTGFKDRNGVVKIEPKFNRYTAARKFDNIMAVTEVLDKKWKSYYLTKAGKVVGQDSLEYYDNSPVCESEGFICFRDRKTDKAGMFNRNGDIVIPAKYNYLSNVTNGMAIGRIGAEKHYMDKNDEHPSWEGGKEQIIDTTDKVLIDDFKYKGNLNFYSLIISDNPINDSTRVNFKSVDGKNYSFVDFEKEFRIWLKSNLLNSFTKDNLLKATYREVAYWKKPKGWIHESKESFIDRNYNLIKEKLFQFNSTTCDCFISSEGLNPFIFSSEEFKGYLNNCGESKDWIYPIQNVIINYQNNYLRQDSFNFLLTDKGYKLLSVSISDGEIK
jgi:hypothetical protein